MPNWDTDKGDLLYYENKRIEVKGSINLFNGPPTFGPKEEWDKIIFVDGLKTLDKIYKVYEFNIPNTDERWQNLKVSKTQTYGDQCLQKRRPRLTFSEILNQLGKESYKIIFDGELLNLQ